MYGLFGIVPTTGLRFHHYLHRCVMLIVWFPPFVLDRLKHSTARTCIWSPEQNRNFVLIVSVIGYHGPTLIMLLCYIFTFISLRKTLKFNFKNNRKVAPLDSTSAVKTNQAESDQSVSYISHHQANPRPRIAADKQRRVFLSLTYIMFAYLICWTPFHIVFDLLYIDASLVSVDVYTWACLMCYWNSMVNPLIYAFTAKDFRRAFKMVLKCNCSNQN